MLHAQSALHSDVIYAGSVCRVKDKLWLVQVYSEGEKIFAKEFYDTMYENSHQSAIQTLQEWSDKLGKTLRRPIVPKEVTEYIGGFLDGDGCVQVRSKKNKQKEIYSVNVRVCFDQAQTSDVPAVLKYIQSFYGGFISTKDRRGEKGTAEKQKISHKLEIHGPLAVWLLKDLISTSILKENQIQTALKIVAEPQLDKKIELMKFVGKAYLKRLDVLNSLQFHHTDPRLTPAYLTGFFDAEGCVLSTGNPVAVFAQKSSISLLHAIREKLGVKSIKAVHVKSSMLVFGSENAVKFFEMAIPLSIVKKEQMEIALRLRDVKKRKVCTKDLEEECKRELKRAKHQ